MYQFCPNCYMVEVVMEASSQHSHTHMLRKLASKLECDALLIRHELHDEKMEKRIYITELTGKRRQWKDVHWATLVSVLSGYHQSHMETYHA